MIIIIILYKYIYNYHELYNNIIIIFFLSFSIDYMLMYTGVYIFHVERFKRSAIVKEKGKSRIRHDRYLFLFLSPLFLFHSNTLSFFIAYVSSRWNKQHEIRVDRLFLPEIWPYPDAWLIVTKVWHPYVLCIFLNSVANKRSWKFARFLLVRRGFQFRRISVIFRQQFRRFEISMFQNLNIHFYAFSKLNNTFQQILSKVRRFFRIEYDANDRICVAHQDFELKMTFFFNYFEYFLRANKNLFLNKVYGI